MLRIWTNACIEFKTDFNSMLTDSQKACTLLAWKFSWDKTHINRSLLACSCNVLGFHYYTFTLIFTVIHIQYGSIFHVFSQHLCELKVLCGAGIISISHHWRIAAKKGSFLQNSQPETGHWLRQRIWNALLSLKPIKSRGLLLIPQE